MSSKQLDISGLASFKSKGLNVPKEWIDEATREVNKSNNEKKLDSSEINKSKDSIIKEYEEKIANLKKEVELARSSERALTKNEEKLLNAIRSEQVNQELDWPLISTNVLRKKYKVHPAYFSQALESLVSLGYIERRETTYSGNIKTYKYRILK